MMGLTGYAKKTTNSEAFQMDAVYEPIGTDTCMNQLESVRANYSTSSDMSHADRGRSVITGVDDNQVGRYLS